MNEINVVRVRWAKGIERVPVKNSDSIGYIIQYMGKKHQIPTLGAVMIQESTKKQIAPRTKLSAIKIENGEQFILELPQSKTPEITNQTQTQTSNDPKLENFRAQWGDHAISLFQIIPDLIVIQNQEKPIITKIEFPDSDAQRISHIAIETNFMSPRIFFMFGTRPKPTTIRVHCTSFPTQSYNNGQFQINEAHRKSAYSLAQKMGLIPVGIVLINSIKYPPITSNILLWIGKQSFASEEHFVIITALPNFGKCQFEAFQISKQFIELSQKEFFVGVEGNSELKTKTPVKLFTKKSETANCVYFLVNVGIISRESWFPKSKFPYQAFHPTPADLALITKEEIAVPNFVKLLDFNLLLFLEAYFSPLEIQKIATACIKKEEIGREFENRINSILDILPHLIF